MSGKWKRRRGESLRRRKSSVFFVSQGHVGHRIFRLSAPLCRARFLSSPVLPPKTLGKFNGLRAPAGPYERQKAPHGPQKLQLGREKLRLGRPFLQSPKA